MQQEEVDRKAIMAKRGPGVHSSFTLLLRTLSASESLSPSLSLSISFFLSLPHTHREQLTKPNPLKLLLQLRSV